MAYSVIKKPSDYFNTKLYTGNGSTQSITGVGFQPDWTWIKERNNAVDHKLYDAVRGATKVLESSNTGAEGTDVNGLTAFNSDGFSLGSSGSNNGSGDTYASWNWLANGAGVANTDGSVNSTVSANTTSGFSIVSWTSLASGSNYTVGHGLGSTPAMIIVKGRHESNSWQVYHHKNTSAPETEYLDLSTADATADYPVWNDTAPTSSVFTCGTWSGFDAGGTMIAYCFADVQGYSKFGSYTGNGSSSGSYIHLGFKPIYLLAKRTDSADEWIVQDGVRAPFNEVDVRLFANSDGAEQTNGFGDVDFLAQGFKWRTNSATLNASGGSYIYMAFAENPFVTSTGVPATAR